MTDLKSHLLHMLSEFWKRRWSILIVTWLVGLLGAFGAASVPDIYASKATVFVDTRSLMRTVLGRDLAISDPAAQIDNVRKSMYARPNIEEVIRRTDLDLTLEDQRAWESLVEAISEKMTLVRQGRDFYQIEYEHADPEKARDIVQALLDIFLEEGLIRSGAGGKDSEATRRYIEDQLATSNERLAAVEERIAEFERTYRDELAGAPSVASEKRGLENELAQIRNDRLLYQQEISSMRSRLASTPQQIVERYITPPTPQRAYIPPPSREKVPVPQGPTLEEQRYQSFLSQVGAVEAEVQSLLRRYTPQHPDVVAAEQRASAARAELAQYRADAERANATLQQRIQQAFSLNAQIDQEYRDWQIQANQPVERAEPQPIYKVNPALADLRAQIDQREGRLTVAEARISQINQQISELQGTLAQQPEILQNYDRMRSEQKKLSRDVAEKQEKLDQILLIDDPTRLNLVEFRVIEPPQVSVKPIGPNRLVLFVGAAMMALGAGVGLAFIRIQLSDNMPTVAHLKRSFDLPVLGGVTMMRSTGQATRTIAANVAFLAGAAAFMTLFAFVTYRFHFELWRPDVNGLVEASGKTLRALI